MKKSYSDSVSSHSDGGSCGSADGDSLRCRWGSVDPDCCQVFVRPVWFLVFLCCASLVHGMLVYGFVDLGLSTLEQRFDISNTESGTIASCYDIASVFCLMPVSYLGGRGRKPLYMAFGLLVLGLGSFIFSLPHFTTGLYEVGEAPDVLCTVGGNSTSCSQTSGPGELSQYKYVFFLGQLLHGAGATPFHTLGIIYLDENLPTGSSALYTGIYYAFALFGPAVGYLAGGGFLTLYTDLDRIDTASLGITNDNPRWVGAWWIGFLISGTVAIIVALPIFGFPRAMPGSENYMAERGKEVYQGKKAKTHEAENQPLGLRHIVTSVKILFTNPTFLFLSLAATVKEFSSASTFGPLFIEFQFGMSASDAARLIGMIAPAGALGMFLGGWLVKRFNMKVRSNIKFCLAVLALNLCCSLIYIFSCDIVPFAGINTQYIDPGSNGKLLDPVQMDHTCNAGCGCSLYDYQPVCGRDNVMYYSPCHAGCTTTLASDSQKHGICSCVIYNYTDADHVAANYWQVEEGRCSSSCLYLVPFLIVNGLSMLLGFMITMPALQAFMRCVPQDQRSFAYGIHSVMTRGLGSVPGRILTGMLLDMSCRVWQQSCQGEGSCLYYDNFQMKIIMMAIGASVHVLSGVFLFLALISYKSPTEAASLELDQDNEAPGTSFQSSSFSTITLPSTSS